MAPSWLFGPLTKDSAEQIVSEGDGAEDGKFLVRRRPGHEEQLILTVVFRKRPTHHLCVPAPDGVMTVNKKKYGSSKTIEELIALLSTKPLPAGWPVLLDKPMVNPEAGSDSAPAPAPTPAAEPPKPVEPTPTPAPEPEAAKPVEASPADPAPAPAPTAEKATNFMHGVMGKADADALMLKNNPSEGKFFMRPRGANFPNDYVLTVVYKGKPTHHLCKQQAPGTPFSVNGKATTATSIDELVEFLRTPKPFWPVPLKEHVPGSGGTSATGPADAGAAQAEAARRQAAEAERKAKEEAKKKAEAEAKAKAEAEAKAKAEAEAKAKAEEEERRKEEEEERKRQAMVEKPSESVRKTEQEKQMESAKAAASAKPAPEEDTIGASDDEEEEERPVSNIRASIMEIRPETDEERAAAARRAANLKRWRDGEQMDITIRRPHPNASFGFGVASLWTIDARVPVISFVDPNGPASHGLEVEDEIVGINGEAVDDMDLEEVKAAIRALDLEFKVRIFRPQKKKGNSSSRAAAGSKAAKKKCSGGVWCPCPKCKKAALKEEQKMVKNTLKVAESMGGRERMTVVLSRRSGEDGNPDSQVYSVI